MNITEATKRACEEPTLLDALSWICVWESERVVKYVREHEGRWETCFKLCLGEVMENYYKDKPPASRLVSKCEKAGIACNELKEGLNRSNKN